MHLDSLDREECRRCKGKHDGRVLICSEIGCPIAIHEKCMCCKPMFDDFGRFYCPYCSYKRALRWTLAFGRNAKAAKKALLDFLGGNKYYQEDGEGEKNEHGAKHLDNCQVEIEKTVVDTGIRVSEKNEQNIDSHVEIGTTVDGLVIGLNGVDTDIRVSEKNEPNVDSHLEKGTTADGLVIGLNEAVDDGIRVLEGNNGRREDEELIQGLDEPANIDRPILEVRTRHIKRRAQRTVHVENVDSSGRLSPPSRKSSNRPTTIAGATPSKTSLESGKQFTNLNFPNAKRKRLNWTNEEEEMLKKGVARFSTANKNIPWRKILEFGCRVFNGTRTPVDLKDKWRNIKD
ncbi:uncharacterized protein LOC107424012 [Ziziphus jujuba]|uniref:Uncharacterized protein LOC107424012 n=1 Tax=Ziziphus jujuba TaxID=326968 RepID=A0A6P4A5D4_ZIZJJ|nr:uncharacterized protein LOC107424012 [Ziziphus jujuba]